MLFIQSISHHVTLSKNCCYEQGGQLHSYNYLSCNWVVSSIILIHTSFSKHCAFLQRTSLWKVLGTFESPALIFLKISSYSSRAWRWLPPSSNDWALPIASGTSLVIGTFSEEPCKTKILWSRTNLHCISSMQSVSCVHSRILWLTGKDCWEFSELKGQRTNLSGDVAAASYWDEVYFSFWCQIFFRRNPSVCVEHCGDLCRLSDIQLETLAMQTLPAGHLTVISARTARHLTKTFPKS